MLFTKVIPGGVRVSGVLNENAFILVKCRGAGGQSHTQGVPQEPGVFSVDIPVSGFQPIDAECSKAIMKMRRTLYVMRPVLNASELQDHFKAQGLRTLLPPNDMHVTVAYSKSDVDWGEVGGASNQSVRVGASLHRSIDVLGDKGAVVLKFRSPALQNRWSYFIRKGASWDYDSYNPHVTLTYKPTVEPGRILPFYGDILLGPEQFDKVNEHVSFTEKADRKSPPEGYPKYRSEYAVPEDYEFPIDGKHIHAAISYFHTHRFKDPAQKRSAAKRILAAAKRHGVAVSDDSDVARAARGD